jgi:excinuclease ABC subunit C
MCGSSKNKNCKPCFNRQIGLCPGPCTGEISKKEYGKTVKHLETFFSGKIDKLVKDLEKEMKSLAKEKRFEEAGVIKNKIYALTHIQDVALIKDENLRAGDKQDAFRIEAYDVAHMSGKNMVGVMTVVEDGILDKNSYRKFKIRQYDSTNDPGALKEILERRFNHPEWPLPSLIVVDGNQIQINVADEILDARRLTIPVVAVVKDERHKAREVIGDEAIIMPHRKDILAANAEAHRFAIGYHKKLRRRNFLV